MKQKKHLDKLKQEYEQNVSAMNYYTHLRSSSSK